MQHQKVIALVAHDHRKKDLIEWVSWNHALLAEHRLVCTGTTGRLVEEALARKAAEAEGTFPVPPIQKLKSGPLGGDQQLGALIAEGKVDVVIFFWDPMQPQAHDVDVKALLRLAVGYAPHAPPLRARRDGLLGLHRPAGGLTTCARRLP